MQMHLHFDDVFWSLKENDIEEDINIFEFAKIFNSSCFSNLKPEIDASFEQVVYQLKTSFQNQSLKQTVNLCWLPSTKLFNEWCDSKWKLRGNLPVSKLIAKKLTYELKLSGNSKHCYNLVDNHHWEVFFLNGKYLIWIQL